MGRRRADSAVPAALGKHSGRKSAQQSAAQARTGASVAAPCPAALLAFAQGPLRDVRAFCLDCLGGEAGEVEACQEARCALHALRLEALHADVSQPEPRQVQRLMLRACRRLCLACAGDRSAVRACDAEGACALWTWRFGVLPQTYAAVTKRFAGGPPAAGECQPACVEAVPQPPEEGGPMPARPARPRKALRRRGARRGGASAGRALLKLCGLK